jgi:serine/threonine protein kinase
MPLSPGTRLGPYEIQSTVGVGGMGEVYRAADRTLGRSVAIKVLPDAFVHDAERLARFEREARTLAALNHPNIAHVYGMETSTGMHALVMELVEGPTLAERIAQGAIPLDEAVAIARQIADALAAAHEQGIIHRDLKPANVKVRDDGTVKVLDFGLAKALDSASATATVSQSPTITTPAMTQAGVILGTAAYMSPEQAKGRTADKRTDIWSFGCVLYEMLTGKRAFEGEDVPDTLAAVLRGEADWGALLRELPPPIVTLLKRCLEKDRRRRIADIAAAQFVLAEQAGLTTSMSAATSDVKPQPARKNVLTLVTAVLLTAILVAAAAWILRPKGPASPPLVRFNFSLGEGQQFTRSGRQVLTISPDGTQIVFAANNRLYRRPIDDLASQVIPGTDLGGSLTQPVFSPDSGWIAFHSSSDATIKRIPVSGGSPTTILQSSALYGMTWGERGIVFGRDDGIFLVSPNGGKPEQLVSLVNGQLENGQNVYGPQILPAGDAVLFTLVRGGFRANYWDTAEIVVQSLTSRSRKTVIEGGSDGRYLPSGHLVYAVSGSLFAVRFDPARQTTMGERVPMLAGVRRSIGPSNLGTAQFSVSNTGTLIYVAGPMNATSGLRTLVVSDRSGMTTSLKLPPGNYSHPRVSQDGARLAVGTDDGQEANVWIYDLAETSALRRLTLKGRNRYPVWSADGQRVAFQSDEKGDRGIFWQRADGSGTAERLTTAPQDAAHVPESFSMDGKHLLFTEQKDRSYVLRSLLMGDKTNAPFGTCSPPSQLARLSLRMDIGSLTRVSEAVDGPRRTVGFSFSPSRQPEQYTQCRRSDSMDAPFTRLGHPTEKHSSMCRCLRSPSSR